MNQPIRAAWNPNGARTTIAAHAHKEGSLLPVLQALQTEFGFIHTEAIDLVSGALNISRAEVHGVLTFYHDFRLTPPPALCVKLCRAEACQARGGREAAQTLLDHFGQNWHELSSDGMVVVEPVFCLGLCAVAPAALIGERLIAGFDGDKLVAEVNAAR